MGLAFSTTDDLNQEAIEAAAQRLALSARGRDALRRLQIWMEHGHCLGLDSRNQGAVLILLDGAWNGLAGTTREAIHAAVAVVGGVQ